MAPAGRERVDAGFASDHVRSSGHRSPADDSRRMRVPYSSHGAGARNAGPSRDVVLQTPPMGGSARALNPNAAVPTWVKGVAAVVVLLVALWAGSKLVSCGAQQATDQPGGDPTQAISTSPVLEDRLASYAPYESQGPTDLDGLPSTTDVSGFALSGQEGVGEPSLSEESKAAIAAAMAPFDEGGYDVGFALMDIGTGRGFARNVDQPIYGASSFKGPYCTFVAQTYVDGGEVALSEVSDSLFNAIVYSDNGTYADMRERFSDAKLVSWLEAQDVSSDIAYDTWYPSYSVRDAAKLWMATHGYLETGTAAANQLYGYFGETRTSFMRTAVTDAAEELEGDAASGAPSLGSSVSDVLAGAIEEANADDIAVFDKAGWYPSDEDDIPAIDDAGIIECNGRDYLLCVMTSMPWNEPNEKKVEALIDAVFNARYDLG